MTKSQPTYKSPKKGYKCPCGAPIYRSTLSKCALQVTPDAFRQSATFATLCPACSLSAEHVIMLRILFSGDFIKCVATQGAFLSRDIVSLLYYFRWLEDLCAKLKLSSSISFGTDPKYQDWDAEQRKSKLSTEDLY